MFATRTEIHSPHSHLATIYDGGGYLSGVADDLLFLFSIDSNTGARNFFSRFCLEFKK